MDKFKLHSSFASTFAPTVAKAMVDKKASVDLSIYYHLIIFED
jgi:hypothetical protein